MRRGVIFWQGITHAGAMAGGALLLSFLARRSKKGGMLAVIGKRWRGHRRGLP